jgi:hypothetical protein
MTRPIFYFESNNSEICYSEDYFQDLMNFEGWSEMDVVEAIPERIPGVFWCNVHCFCGENTAHTCGRQCREYKPRNGKNGRCRHHSVNLFTHGNPVTLKRKNG